MLSKAFFRELHYAVIYGKIFFFYGEYLWVRVDGYV